MTPFEKLNATRERIRRRNEKRQQRSREFLGGSGRPNPSPDASGGGVSAFTLMLDGVNI